MALRTIIVSLIVMATVGLLGLAASGEPSRRPTDPFALDGARNILDEDAFGIVNGKLTVGIPYRNAFAISGLWAPPYVSSDFSLGITLLGQPVATDRYTWHPFQVDRAGSIQGIAVESVTMLIPGTRAGLVEVTLKNPASEPREVPVAIAVGGTLDRVGSGGANPDQGWEFGRPQSQTATTRKAADGSLIACARRPSHCVARQQAASVGTIGSRTGAGFVSLPPSGHATFFVAFAVGPVGRGRGRVQENRRRSRPGHRRRAGRLRQAGARPVPKTSPLRVEQSGPRTPLLPLAGPFPDEPLGRARVPAAPLLQHGQRQGRVRLQLPLELRRELGDLPALRSGSQPQRTSSSSWRPT